MHRRDNATMTQFQERCETPRARQLIAELREMLGTLRPGEEEYGSPAVRVRFDRLRFELSREMNSPTEKVTQRWTRHGLPDLETEYLERNERGFLQSAIPDLDRRIEAARADGIDAGDDYLVTLRKLRRELQRRLRQLSPKARAASA